MAERSERKPPSGVSYSKWDRIETSDDESEPAATQPLEPLLESRKRNADRDSDEALAKRFIGHLQQHSKVPVPPALREMVARFVAVTDKRENASNTFRYADIVAFGARYQTELVNRGMVDALCELHRQMLDGIKLESPNPPKDAVVADMHKLMDAINTLEALRTTTNAAHFFEQVCGYSWIALDGLGWPRMASDGLGWPRMASDGLGWHLDANYRHPLSVADPLSRCARPRVVTRRAS